MKDQEDQSHPEQEATSKNVTDLHLEHRTPTTEEKDESVQEEEEETEEARVCVDENEWQTSSDESLDVDHAEEKPESTAVSSFYNSSCLLRQNELLCVLGQHVKLVKSQLDWWICRKFLIV